MDKKDNVWMIISGILVVLLILVIVTNNLKPISNDLEEGQETTGNLEGDAQEIVKELPKISTLTFKNSDNEICTSEGKPIIRLFSTTWCPHCKWITETYGRVVSEYVDDGKMVAYHWELDTNDDTLTDEIESEVPADDLAEYKKFNPSESIPTFVFGCKYYRIGNGYEKEGEAGLLKEESEFREIIDRLIEGGQ